MKKQQSEGLHKQLRERLHTIFQDYAQGLDVSPAARYRTEGFAEALITMGELSEQQCIEMMAEVYQTVFAAAMDTSAITQMRIPPLMKRAPVYPSAPSST